MIILQVIFYFIFYDKTPLFYNITYLSSTKIFKKFKVFDCSYVFGFWLKYWFMVRAVCMSACTRCCARNYICTCVHNYKHNKSAINETFFNTLISRTDMIVKAARDWPFWFQIATCYKFLSNFFFFFRERGGMVGCRRAGDYLIWQCLLIPRHKILVYININKIYWKIK